MDSMSHYMTWAYYLISIDISIKLNVYHNENYKKTQHIMNRYELCDQNTNTVHKSRGMLFCNVVEYEYKFDGTVGIRLYACYLELLSEGNGTIVLN